MSSVISLWSVSPPVFVTWGGFVWTLWINNTCCVHALCFFLFMTHEFVLISGFRGGLLCNMFTMLPIHSIHCLHWYTWNTVNSFSQSVYSLFTSVLDYRYKNNFEKECENINESRSGSLVSLSAGFNMLSPMSLVTQLFVGVCVVQGVDRSSSLSNKMDSTALWGSCL